MTTANATAKRNAASRDAILASIREHLAASTPFDNPHAMHRQGYPDRGSPGLSPLTHERLLGDFEKNLGLVGGHLHIAKNETEAAAALRSMIESHEATKIAISDSPLVASIAQELSDVEFVQDADREFLFGSDLGITSAQWGIAETGTLVLESDAERHRLTSLVPPVHICILEARSVRQTLGEILETIDPRRSRTVTFITGASRTSDIELTLAIGVHGPRELHVILIDR